MCAHTCAHIIPRRRQKAARSRHKILLPCYGSWQDDIYETSVFRVMRTVFANPISSFPVSIRIFVWKFYIPEHVRFTAVDILICIPNMPIKIIWEFDGFAHIKFRFSYARYIQPVEIIIIKMEFSLVIIYAKKILHLLSVRKNLIPRSYHFHGFFSSSVSRQNYELVATRPVLSTVPERCLYSNVSASRGALETIELTETLKTVVGTLYLFIFLFFLTRGRRPVGRFLFPR